MLQFTFHHVNLLLGYYHRSFRDTDKTLYMVISRSIMGSESYMFLPWIICAEQVAFEKNPGRCYI